MKAWMEGYNSDINYRVNYIKELNPNYLNLCLVLSGTKPIPIEESFSYCELGCGYGLSTLINAANYPQGTFYALDYNPSQITYAKEMAKEAGLTNIHFLENSFQDIIDNPSLLPSFDFIVFHGIYSWVSDENRQNLIDICANHLNAGGLVYNSYNAKPGWFSGEVTQQLIYAFSEEELGNSIEKIEPTLNRLDRVLKIESGFLAQNKKRLAIEVDRIKKGDRKYVTHEYINEGWRAFFFPDVANAMQGAKLDYHCLAELGESFANEVMSPNLKKILSKIGDVNNRELIKDITLNTQFRKDIYLRGGYGEMNATEIQAWFRDKKWILLIEKKVERYKFRLVSGDMDSKREPFDTILKYLSQKNLTTYELHQQCGLPFKQIMSAVILLVSNGYIGEYQPQKKQAQQLNKVIVKRVFDNPDIGTICYPNVNLGVNENQLTRMWLKAIMEGNSNPTDLVVYVYNRFTFYGKNIVLEGKTLEGEALKNYLKKEEVSWRKYILPVWIKVGVISIAKKA